MLKFVTKIEQSFMYDAIVYTGKNINEVIEFFPEGGVGTRGDFEKVLSSRTYKEFSKSDLLLSFADGFMIQKAEKGDILLRKDGRFFSYSGDNSCLVEYGENMSVPIFLPVVTKKAHCPKCLSRLKHYKGGMPFRASKGNNSHSYKCESCGYEF